METIDMNADETEEQVDIENVGIELTDVESSVQPSDNSFSEIKAIEPKNYKNRGIQKSAIQNEKMPTCGTWGEGCLYCCCMPLLCIGQSCRLCFSCCGPLLMQMKQLYFFILYLFTGELNKEAVEYKQYFNIKSTKDDQVNIPEILITATSIVFELYKTMIGSFLTVFTAQRCGQQTCTIWENIVPKNDLELAGIVINFFMATTLLIEYIFEIMREAYLIKYLKYDKSLANNGEHIAELYENTDKSIFAKLIPLYVIYIRFSYVVLLIYFVNVVLSAVIVAGNYYDNTSIFSFVTNALFIIYKIYNVVEITSYRGDYFYSAYKRKNIHYNDIKPKYLLRATSENRSSQNVGSPHIFRSNANENAQEIDGDIEASSPNIIEDSANEVVENTVIISENTVPDSAVINENEVNENAVIDIAPFSSALLLKMCDNPSFSELRVALTSPEEPIKNPTIQDIVSSLFTSTKAIVPKPSKSRYIDIDELDELELDDAQRDKVLKELYKKNYIDKMVFFQEMMVGRKKNKA